MDLEKKNGVLSIFLFFFTLDLESYDAVIEEYFLFRSLFYSLSFLYVKRIGRATHQHIRLLILDLVLALKARFLLKL